MAFRGILPSVTTHGQFMNSQEYKYNTVLPRGLPIPAESEKDPVFMSNAQKAVGTSDPYLGKLRDARTLTDFQNLFYTSQLSDDILQQAEFCRKTDIDQLIQAQDKNSSIRCGWLYMPSDDPINVPTPKVSQGYLGITDGPFQFLSPPPQNAEWIWNLEDARKKVLTDRCKGLRICENIGNDRYKSCGYCTGLAQGVPVNASGSVMYPTEPRLNCTNGKIITQAAQCPQPLVPPPAVPGEPPKDICSAFEGRLSKDCILDVISKSGCTERGALYTAIENNTNPADYLNLLRSSQSLKIYNERAVPKLNTEIFRQGQATRNMIVNEVQQLATTAAQNPGATGLGLAARDLCTVRGAMDEWDQCGEIPDTATAPYDLNCLQTNFRRIGGQPSAKKYPTIETKATIYDRIPTYRQVKQYLQGLLDSTKSPIHSAQRAAMIDFYGIDPLVETVNPVPVLSTPMYNLGDVGMPPGHIDAFPGIVLISTQLVQNQADNAQDNSLLANLKKNVSSGKKYRLTFKTNNQRQVYFTITNITTRSSSGNTWAYLFNGAPQNIQQLIEGARQASITIQEFS